MKNLKKINIDWKKRFKDLYVDTDNKAKNFFRLDWTKKSIERKKQFNKKVDYTISYASALNDVYNNMVDLLSKLNSDYTTNLNSVTARINGALTDSNSIQSKISNLLNEVKKLEAKIQTAISTFRKPAVSINNRNLKLSYTGKSSSQITNYNTNISVLKTTIGSIKHEIEKLNSEKDNKLSERRNLESSKNNLSILLNRLINELHVSQNPPPGGPMSNPQGSRGLPPGANNRRMPPRANNTRNIISIRRDISKTETEIANINNTISTLNRGIKSIESELTSENLRLSSTKSNLRQLDNEIITNSNAKIDKKLAAIRKFVSEKKAYIRDNSSSVTNLRDEVLAIAKNGNILSLDDINKLNNKVEQYFKSISTFTDLTKISDKKNDYGEGFFRFISTKEENLEELKNKFSSIQKSMEETYSKMLKYRSKIERYNNSEESSKAKSDIEGKLPGIIARINKLELDIDGFVKQFKTDMGSIKIITIKPFYDSSGLLDGVKEVEIIL